MATQQSVEPDALRRALASMVNQDWSLRAYRVVVGVAERMPELGQRFYEDGPARGVELLSTYFDARVRDGKLSIPDTKLDSTLTNRVTPREDLHIPVRVSGVWRRSWPRGCPECLPRGSHRGGRQEWPARPRRRRLPHRREVAIDPNDRHGDAVRRMQRG